MTSTMKMIMMMFKQDQKKIVKNILKNASPIMNHIVVLLVVEDVD